MDIREKFCEEDIKKISRREARETLRSRQIYNGAWKQELSELCRQGWYCRAEEQTPFSPVNEKTLPRMG